MHFVQITGIDKGKQDEEDTRKAIRRHVMMGKNTGRTPTNPKKPTLPGTTVMRLKREDPKDSEDSPVIPMQVGSHLSFLEFADSVDQSLMHDTLWFCTDTNHNLFMLAPYMSFAAADPMATCIQPLALDSLYMNVMVFTTQVYKDIVSATGQGSSEQNLQHYGKALAILRERLSAASALDSTTSDLTIMAVLLLALHSLITGDSDGAVHHASGLSSLVNMKGGIEIFRSRTKEMIEILRGDICISFATGRAPFFSYSANQEPYHVQPESEVPGPTPSRPIIIFDIDIGRAWDTLHAFCARANNASHDNKVLSEDMFLDTMASATYTALSTPVPPLSRDKVIQLAILSFSAITFLQWRQLRIPWVWLQCQFKNTLTHHMRFWLDETNPETTLWLLLIYGITFPRLAAAEEQELQQWLIQAIGFSGFSTCYDIKNAMTPYLWIGTLCDSRASKVVKGALKVLQTHKT